MSGLGDLFPDGFKRNFAERNVAVKSVVRTFINFPNQGKEKRCIIVGISSYGVMLALVFINTDINLNFITPQLMPFQLEVKALYNNFIDYDCYIDCSKIWEMPIADVIAYVQSNPQNVLGTVSDEDFEKISALLNSSPKIAPNKIKKYNSFG